jgi:hypothetical protein
MTAITTNRVHRTLNLNYEDFVTLGPKEWLSGDIIDIIFDNI